MQLQRQSAMPVKLSPNTAGLPTEFPVSMLTIWSAASTDDSLNFLSTVLNQSWSLLKLVLTNADTGAADIYQPQSKRMQCTAKIQPCGLGEICLYVCFSGNSAHLPTRGRHARFAASRWKPVRQLSSGPAVGITGANHRKKSPVSMRFEDTRTFTVHVHSAARK